MRFRSLVVSAVAVAQIGLVAPGSALPHSAYPQRRDHPKLSPFEAVRWSNERPEVQLDGRWYAVTAMDGLAIDAVLAHCRATYGDKAVKRFEEDLVEVLDGLGISPKTTCDLTLMDLTTRETIERAGVPMTAENRSAILRAALARSKADREPAIGRARRVHAEEPAKEFEWLVVRSPATGARAIPRDAALDDLDALEWLIESRYAYRDLHGVDYRAAIDTVRLSIGDSGVDTRVWPELLGRLVALFGDGHSGVEAPDSTTDFAPFLVEESRGRLLALAPDRSAFFDPEHPVLEKIDGRTGEE